MDFEIQSKYRPTGDQPEAIAELAEGVRRGDAAQTLLGVTGSGKTFTMANVIEKVQRPTLILSHNKTLAAQLYAEMKGFFPNNSVQYFISYYDYYQPEAYIPTADKYIEKDLMINEEIDRLRLATTSALLSGRKDVIVVSSVSCLFGMGNPADFNANTIDIHVGQKVGRNAFLRQLVDALYSRNEADLGRGTFRVRGDTVDIRLAYEDIILRVMFWGDEIESIQTLHAVDLTPLGAHDRFNIYPANLFVTTRERQAQAVRDIQLDLGRRIAFFEEGDQHLFAQRIEERVTYDVEMIKEIGHCPGIENYSRYFDRRNPGERPFCLLDYFPDDFLTIIDESHVTVPQIRAMYGGDRSRKQNLVDYAFRLPAALDNRPLKFNEFEALTPQTIYVSATPADYEMERSQGVVVEQIIRPTGLLDPKIEVRPSQDQIDDLLEEIQQRKERDERVLVTTLTKRMAEELNEYLTRMGIASAYIHSDVETMDRIRILDGLRAGEYDVLVGVNLLREGLDLPEVSLVAILDADKEGFLRNHRSLTQTAGRAARNLNGMVIMYADKVTDSMQQTIDETERRRNLQMQYNAEHGITPKAIVKARNTVIGQEPPKAPMRPGQAILPEKPGVDYGERGKKKTPSKRKKTGLADMPMPSKRTMRPKVIYDTDYRPDIAIAADPVIQYMSRDQLAHSIDAQRERMVKAARDMDFTEAARIRDEIIVLQERLDAMSTQTE